MKALQYAKAVPSREGLEEYERFDIDPDQMYPAAVAYTRTLLEPGADVPMYLQQHVQKLREAGLPEKAWGDAIGERSKLDDDALKGREAILEAARLIFTARLREQVGGPINPHILRNDYWRL